ncbi:hypothetical protein Pelo_14106 [Pelomyxa schiedti]|nr:hypothetical protein Pelo_14106 [Pelomyxa schiedti]
MHPQSAYAVAAVVHNVSKSHPKFTEIMNQQFWHSCCYTRPSAATTEALQAMSIDKMVGYLSLWGALLLHRSERDTWKWIAQFLNMPTFDRHCPEMLLAVLEITGDALHAAYGNTYHSLIQTIWQDLLQHPSVQPVPSHVQNRVKILRHSLTLP